MPISWVRWLAENETTPYTPTTARLRAQQPDRRGKDRADPEDEKSIPSESDWRMVATSGNWHVGIQRADFILHLRDQLFRRQPTSESARCGTRCNPAAAER